MEISGGTFILVAAAVVDGIESTLFFKFAAIIFEVVKEFWILFEAKFRFEFELIKEEEAGAAIVI